MVTGTMPEVHHAWQVALRDTPPGGWKTRAQDLLPDLVSTTWQCARYAMDKSRDLPAVPAWRRHRLKLHRVKYGRRGPGGRAVLDRIGGAQSIFGLMGGAADYRLAPTREQMRRCVTQLPDPGYALQMLEYYGLDLFTHWHLDDAEAMRTILHETDTLVGEMAQQARERGVTFVLLVDHGQERVRERIDLEAVVRRLGLPRASYTHFTEVASARFWFHSDDAARAIREALAALEGVTVLERPAMAEYGVSFADDRFGELFVYADAGRAFFPHDFYQPLGNRYIALRAQEQRPRGRDPRHRGTHGHLPMHDSETGYLVVADEAARPAVDWGHVVDVAPTLLDYLGRPVPEAMAGRVLYTTQAEAAGDGLRSSGGVAAVDRHP